MNRISLIINTVNYLLLGDDSDEKLIISAVLIAGEKGTSVVHTTKITIFDYAAA